MSNSVTLYEEACNFVQNNPKDDYWRKNFYLQIVTTIFYELMTHKTSPLISKFCADNAVKYPSVNFTIEPLPLGQTPSSFDMYCILQGLAVAFSENLDTCAQYLINVNNFIFRRQILPDESRQGLIQFLQVIDWHMKKFQPVEKIVVDEEDTALMKNLDDLAQNRKADDEKIIDEIKKVQLTLQDELGAVQQSLKQISDIRDGIDYRSLKEPIYQLIQLYKKIDDNVKRHPITDTAKGYATLIKRLDRFLIYVTQALKMLGVEIIDEAGGIFDPDKNKVADDERVSLDSTVTKVNKIGFIYKGQILEKAEVEVAAPSNFNCGGNF